MTTPAPAFLTPRFQDALDAPLAAARWGAADPAEVLATAARVLDGDADSWLSAGADVATEVPLGA